MNFRTIQQRCKNILQYVVLGIVRAVFQCKPLARRLRPYLEKRYPALWQRLHSLIRQYSLYAPNEAETEVGAYEKQIHHALIEAMKRHHHTK